MLGLRLGFNAKNFSLGLVLEANDLSLGFAAWGIGFVARYDFLQRLSVKFCRRQ